MSKSSPSPPAAPDPVALANAQSAANIATATAQQKLNLINTQGPTGSVSYQASDAPGGYTQVTNLSPDQTALYNQVVGLQQGALGTAQDQLGRVSGALSQGLTAPHLQTSLAPSGSVTSSFAPSGDIQSNVNGLGNLQSSYGNGGNIQSSYGAGGPIQMQVGDNNATGAVNQAANTAWLQAMSRLAPAYQLQSQQLRDQLAAQGVGVNSAAYQNAQDIFGRQVNDALNQAAYGAVQTGNQEQNTLYNQALSSGQFANAAQQQGNQQNLQAGQFANQAQQQGNQQNLQASELANQSALAQFQAGLAQQQAQNQAQQQQFAQNQAAALFANQAQQQSYLQNLGAAQFGNQALGQQFQANAEAQNQPINQLTALAGLGQVQTPQGISYTPTTVAPTDVIGAQSLSTAAQQAAYNSQMQNQSGLFGGLFNLGSSILGAGTSGGGTLAASLFGL